jgi:glutaminase
MNRVDFKNAVRAIGTAMGTDQRKGMTSDELPLYGFLNALHERHRANFEGKLADYIPELAKAKPEHFGMVLATADGFAYAVGDADQFFTAQSVSKPLVYALALEDHGLPFIQSRIGVEPSGDPFNSITFDERNNRPFNPMVNAGAITAASLIKGTGIEERFERIIGMFERLTGRRPALDEAVYVSERETGHRNRAIGYLALNAGMITGPLDEHLDLYFRQCSLSVTARDLAIAAATLANDGINPLTGLRAVKSEHVRAVLSVMSSCGMYDYAGEWQFDVGLPAKSGVSGGIAAVLPGQLGLGLYSPLVDPVGNSIRGVKVCEELSRHFRLHLLEQRASAKTAIRRIYAGAEVRSKRVRAGEDSRKLDKLGRQIEVVELQGDLLFAEAEKISRRIIQDSATVTFFILDTERAYRIDPVAFDLLYSVRRQLADRGKHLVLAGSDRFASWQANWSSAVPDWFASIDQALEFFEDRLLDLGTGGRAVEEKRIAIGNFDLLHGLAGKDLGAIEKRGKVKKFAQGDRLVEMNTPSDGVFFLLKGRVDVSIPLAGSAKPYRVGTIDAGNVFGELALFDSFPRTANINGATAGEVLVLRNADLNALKDEAPAAYLRLVLAMGRSLAERLRRANEEIRALAR